MAAKSASAHESPTFSKSAHKTESEKSEQDAAYDAEIQGLTLLTMTDTKKKQRDVSWANVALPPMQFAEGDDAGQAAEDSDDALAASASASDAKKLRKKGSFTRLESVRGGGRARSNSDSKLFTKVKVKKEAQNRTLAYWKLETELRLAKDKLLAKMEECANLEQYKEQFTAEMDDLTATVFEEAQEMVRAEKKARAAAEKKYKETADRAELLNAELEALKTVVMHQRSQAGQSGYVEKSKASDAPQPRTVLNGKADPTLMTQVVHWVKAPTLNDEGEFMKRMKEEDIQFCLRFHPSADAQAKTILQNIKGNNVVVEQVAAKRTPCALCKVEELCAFRLRNGEEPPVMVCESSRNKIVAVGDFYMYARHVVQGLVKSNVLDIYWKFMKLRLAMSRARIGLSLDES